MRAQVKVATTRLFRRTDAPGGFSPHVLGREGQPIAYEVNFQLQGLPGPERVQGQASGGAAGTAIYLSPSAPAADSPGALKALLGTDGAFIFEGVAPSEYQVNLDGIGLIAERVLLEADGVFTLLFPMRSSVQGRVLIHPADWSQFYTRLRHRAGRARLRWTRTANSRFGGCRPGAIACR